VSASSGCWKRNSEWKETDERGVLAAVIELARLNRAAHAADRGSINRPKARSARALAMKW